MDTITSNKDVWVDEMMKDELGMMEDSRSPFKIGAVTYVSFLVIGLIPLMIYVYDFFFEFEANRFLTTCLMTGFAFLIIGWLKSKINETNFYKGILETILLGALAASLAYYAGAWLEHFIGS